MSKPARPTRGVGAISAGLVVFALSAPVLAIAQTVTVPDDYATLQSAHDSGASLILVRPGNYEEGVTITRPLTIRGIVPAGSWPDSLPVASEIVFANLTGFFTHSQDLKIENLRVTEAVRNTYTINPYSNPLTIQIADCVLESGLHDMQATVAGQLHYEVVGCIIEGPITLGLPQHISFDGCTIRQPMSITGVHTPDHFRLTNSTVTGSGRVGVDICATPDDLVVEGNTFEGHDLALRIESSPLWITGNVFRGPGRCAISIGEAYGGDVIGNTISGFDVGIHHSGTGTPGLTVPNETRLGGSSGRIDFSDNHIENCSTIGTYILAKNIESVRDTIRSCGAGAILLAVERLEVLDDRILDCAGDGLALSGERALLEGNVVGRCGGNGIIADIPAARARPWTLWLRHNTSYLNGGNGYSVDFTQYTLPAEIDHNIGYGNGGYGLEVVSDDSLTVGCNDWFANTAGPVSGIPMGATDLAADPQFCGLDSDDVSLLDPSPLLDVPECGLIGALGLGCGATPTLLQILVAEPGENYVTIRWQFSPLEPPSYTWLERGPSSVGPWSRLNGVPFVQDGRFVQQDADLRPGTEYWYRVGWPRESGTGYSEPVMSALSIPARSSLTVSPNPSFGPVSIAWTMQRAGEVDAQVFDLGGRHVASVSRGRFAAGQHLVRWDGRQTNGALAPAGWYVVKLRGPGTPETRRFLLVR